MIIMTKMYNPIYRIDSYGKVWSWNEYLQLQIKLTKDVKLIEEMFVKMKLVEIKIIEE